MSIGEWLRAIGLESLIETFERQNIELDVVRELTEADLQAMGLTIGQIKRCLRAAQDLVPHGGPTGLAGGTKLAAERRHLTVLFCDLVGSTALAERLDAEDLMQVLQHYQSLCLAVIGSYDGYVARYLGDGMLVYFGYPVADEAAAHNALRAALGILRQVGAAKLPGGAPMQVRIGIASGMVVVGKLPAPSSVVEHPAIGMAPNIAARLQALAGPNQVLVGEATYRLTSDGFRFEERGRQAIHGISEPVRFWQLTGETIRRQLSSVLSRWQRVPFVNRDETMLQLERAWQAARNGRGRMIFVSGEPGVGKSCLVHRFLAGLRQDVTIRAYGGAPSSQDSPLHPIIEWLRLGSDIRLSDPPAAVRAKLEKRLPGGLAERSEQLDLIAALLSPRAALDMQRTASARQLRERTLAALGDAFVAICRVRPLVNLIEDYHWLDPTTIELLDRLAPTLADLPALVLMTSREPCPAGWRALPHVETVTLARLAPAASRQLAQGIAGPAPLAPELLERIAEHAEGNPLFIEQLTRNIVESGATPAAAGLPGAFGVPLSLADNLMARLDRLGDAKRLARTGAVLGRSFTRELVLQVGDFEPAWLEAALGRLLEAGIVYERTDVHGASEFAFKHTLVQETAYGSILREERQQLHARAADAIARLMPLVAEEQPEVLAQHLAAAGERMQAVRQWLRAGSRNVAQSAIVEAERQLRRGLDLLDQLTESEPTRQLRLQLLALLGPATIALHGPGSTEAEAVYVAGYALCDQLPEAQSHFPIYWGWWRLSRDFHTMEQRADRLLERARAHGDEGLMLQAHHCQWASHFNRGDLAGCLAHIDHGLAIYERGRHASHATLYGNHDACVCGHIERALVFWLQGRLKTSLREEREALARAEALGHAGSSMHLKDGALTLRFYRREVRAVLQHAAVMIEYAEAHGFSDHRAKAQIYRGWATALLGRVAQGRREMETGLARQQAQGTSEDFFIYYDMLAEVLTLDGQYEAALAGPLTAARELEALGLRIWVPELRRRRGLVLEKRTPADPAPALAAFHEALDQARQQQAVVLGLRAALEIARVWLAHGIAGDVDGLLRPWLDEPELEGATEVAAASALLAVPAGCGRG